MIIKQIKSQGEYYSIIIINKKNVVYHNKFEVIRFLVNKSEMKLLSLHIVVTTLDITKFGRGDISHTLRAGIVV
jgi:hypothetical protein